MAWRKPQTASVLNMNVFFTITVCVIKHPLFFPLQICGQLITKIWLTIVQMQVTNSTPSPASQENDWKYRIQHVSVRPSINDCWVIEQLHLFVCVRRAWKWFFDTLRLFSPLRWEIQDKLAGNGLGIGKQTINGELIRLERLLSTHLPQHDSCLRPGRPAAYQ